MTGRRRVQTKTTAVTAAAAAAAAAPAAAQPPGNRMQSNFAEMQQRFAYLLQPSASQRGAEGGGPPLADCLGSRFDADLQRLQWAWMRSQMENGDGEAETVEDADSQPTAEWLALMSLPPDPLQSGRRADEAQPQSQPPDGPPVDQDDCDLITFTIDDGSESSKQTGTTGSLPQPSSRDHDQHAAPGNCNRAAEA